MTEYEVPEKIMTTLLGAMVRETAQFVAASQGEYTLINPGDPFVDLVSWLWSSGHDSDAAHVILSLRETHLDYVRKRFPDQALSEIDVFLRYLQSAMNPTKISDAEAANLMHYVSTVHGRLESRDADAYRRDTRGT